MANAKPQIPSKRQQRVLVYSNLCICSQTKNVQTVQTLLSMGSSTKITDSNGDTPLHKACISEIDALQKVDLLLEHDSSLINAQNKNGTAPIHIAAHKADSSILRVLVKRLDCDVKIRTNKKLTALHVAAHFGQLQNVHLLLNQRHTDANAFDCNGDTPAHHAAANGHQDILVLIASHTNRWCPHLTNKHKRTADQESKLNIELLHSVQNDNMDKIRELLAKGARWVSRGRDGETPLHKACRSKISTREKAALLLEHDICQLNDGNKYGHTPLHIVAARGHADVINLFLNQAQVEVNVLNNNWSTPLHVAARFNQCNVMESLIKSPNIDVNLQDRDGNMFTHIAATYRQDVFTVQLSGCPDLDINRRNHDGNTAIEIAVQRNNDTVVKQLLECPNLDFDQCVSSLLIIAARLDLRNDIPKLLTYSALDLNVQDNKGNTAPHYAAQFFQSDVIRKFLSCPTFDVNTKNHDGNTVAHIAARFDTRVGIDVLLACPRIDVNLQNHEGNTPAHVAARYSYINVIMRFLDDPRLKNVNLKNKNGNSVLHIAAQFTGSDVIEELLAVRTLDVNLQNCEGNTPAHVAAKALNITACWDISKHSTYDSSITNNRQQTAADILQETYSAPLDNDMPLSTLINARLNNPAVIHTGLPSTEPLEMFAKNKKLYVFEEYRDNVIIYNLEKLEQSQSLSINLEDINLSVAGLPDGTLIIAQGPSGWRHIDSDGAMLAQQAPHSQCDTQAGSAWTTSVKSDNDIVFALEYDDGDVCLLKYERTPDWHLLDHVTLHANTNILKTSAALSTSNIYICARDRHSLNYSLFTICRQDMRVVGPRELPAGVTHIFQADDDGTLLVSFSLFDRDLHDLLHGHSLVFHDRVKHLILRRFGEHEVKSYELNFNYSSPGHFVKVKDSLSKYDIDENDYYPKDIRVLLPDGSLQEVPIELDRYKMESIEYATLYKNKLTFIDKTGRVHIFTVNLS